MKTKNIISFAGIFIILSIVFVCAISQANGVSKSTLNVYTDLDKNNSKISEQEAEAKINNILKNVDRNAETFTNKSFVKEDSLRRNKWVLENENSIAELDENGEPILFIDKSKTEQICKKELSTVKMDKNKIIEKASKFAEKLDKKERVVEGIYELDNGQTVVKWNRTYMGYKYDFDFLSVTLDSFTGELSCFSKQYVSKIPSINVKLDKNSAVEIANSLMKSKNGIGVGEVLRVDTLVVNPNNYWTKKGLDTKLNNDCRLGFAITFKRIEPFEGEATIWIDAENGAELGGTQTK